MGKRRKYRDHEQFGANAPLNWRARTTAKAYIEGKEGRKGMQRIAPPGMTPREDRARRFEERTKEPQSARWHHNYDIAMFGGTDIPAPNSETKQLAMEKMLNGIPRIPQVKRS